VDPKQCKHNLCTSSLLGTDGRQFVRLAVITSKFPFEGKEAFLHAEIAQLAKRVSSLVIIPATASQKEHEYANLPGLVVSMSVASMSTMITAMSELLKAPILVTGVFLDVVSGPRSLRTKLGNALIFPKALSVARFLREKNITHVHAYWLSTPSTIAYVNSRLSAAGWSASGHRWDLVDTNLTSQPGAHAGFMQAAKFIRTISERGRRQVLFALAGGPHGRVETIHLGVDIPRPVPHKPRVSGPFSLACIAAMERVKGHVYLLQALASALAQGIDLRCDLIGDGSLRTAIQQQATALGIADKVRFAGWIPHETVRERLQQGRYDAAILTSIDEGYSMCEGIPVALMEAMASQIPCIATDSGSVNELIDAEVGILVPQRDSEEIAAAIVALARNPDRRLELGQRAAKRIHQEFEVRRTAAALHALIVE